MSVSPSPHDWQPSTLPASTYHAFCQPPYLPAMELGQPPSDEHVGESIEKAEQLLEGVDEEPRQVRKVLDEL